MKSECADIPIVEIAAPAAKQYADQTLGDEIIKKAKGVKKCVIKRRLSFEDYKMLCFPVLLRNAHK